MGVLTNLPDWGAPLDGADGPAWLVSGQPQRGLASATGLVLERDNGRPGYALETFRTSSDAGLDGFGVLTMRFVGDYRLAERRKALFSTLPGVHLDFIPLQDGFVRFFAARPLDMQGLDKAQPLVSAGSGVKLTRKLPGHGISAFNSLVSAGDVPVLAQIIYQAKGQAVRARGTAKVDGSALLPQLQAAPGGLWSRSMLVDAVKSNQFGPALAVESEETEPMAISRAIDAAIDRLTALGFVLKAAEQPESEPMWEVQAEALSGRTLALRLDDDFVAPRAFLLRSPALAPPDMVERDIEDDYGPITMATGIHVVTIDANLPPVRIGVARTGAELTVPANPPHRPETIRKTLTFDGLAGLAAVTLRLAPDEPLAFDYQTFVIALAGGSAERLEGPKLRNEDSHLTLSPSAFPVNFQRAEATPAILQFGSVAVGWSAARAAGTWKADALLTPSAPVVAVAIPPSCDDLVVTAELVAADGSGRLALPAETSETLWFDLSGVPQARPQSVSFQADFGGKGGTIMLECLSESEVGSDAQPTLIALRKASHEAEYRWLPDNPFRAGFRCRWSATDGSVSEWSPPYPGGSVIRMVAGSERTDPWPGIAVNPHSAPAQPDKAELGGEPVDTTGLELFSAGDGNYVYRPKAPQLQRSLDGKPAIQLLGTDASGFLQITAEWTVGAHRLAELSAVIEKRDGAPPKLAPAPDSVRETALEIVQDDGNYAVAATGTAVGVPPQTSLLTATLVAGQADAVRRAMAGERGLARLRYTIDAAEPVSTERSFAATASGGGTHAAFASHDSAGSFNRHVIESVTDLADAMKS